MKKKTVSYSQFANWWVCPYRWMRDYILKEKVFEDSIHMSFGTAVHEAIQLFLTTLFTKGAKDAEAIDIIPIFTAAFKREVTKKGIKHTPEEFAEFVEDGRAILAELLAPANYLFHFDPNKWELLGIEKKFLLDVVNNVTLDSRLDIVFKEKMSGDIRIVDLKTATNEWNNYTKEDFTKTSQLMLYKAAYSKANNIPLSKIHVEFIILKRKLTENAKYEQSRIQVFKPPAFQDNVMTVLKEFRQFVEYSFTKDGQHNTSARYPKLPGKNRNNCRFCTYAKNGKCDQMAEPPIRISE